MNSTNANYPLLRDIFDLYCVFFQGKLWNFNDTVNSGPATGKCSKVGDAFSDFFLNEPICTIDSHLSISDPKIKEPTLFTNSAHGHAYAATDIKHITASHMLGYQKLNSECYPLYCSQNVNKELSNILNELWKLDKNRLSPGTDYTISLQV